MSNDEWCRDGETCGGVLQSGHSTCGPPLRVPGSVFSFLFFFRSTSLLERGISQRKSSLGLLVTGVWWSTGLAATQGKHVHNNSSTVAGALAGAQSFRTKVEDSRLSANPSGLSAPCFCTMATSEWLACALTRWQSILASALHRRFRHRDERRFLLSKHLLPFLRKFLNK